MLTRPGVGVVVGAVATLVAARLFGIGELFIVGTALAVLPLAALVWVRRPLPELAAERVVRPRRVQVGASSRVELLVANRGRRRTPVLVLHDPVEGTVGARVAVAPMAAGAAQQAGYRLPTERRGMVRIGPLSAELTDPFGLARRRFAVAHDAALTVLPGIDLLPGVPVGGGRDEPMAGVVRRSVAGSGTDDLATLRPYVVGDDLRRIHWPSTARTGDLLVRQDDVRWQGHLTVVLEVRSSRIGPAAFELAVSAAASILHAVGRHGDRARLLFTDGTDSGLVDARTASDTLLEHLAMAGRADEGRLPRLPTDGRLHTGTLVVVTGSPDEADVAALEPNLATFGRVLLVTIAPSAVGAGPDPGRPSVPAGVELVPVDATTPFALAWAGALDRPRGVR